MLESFDRYILEKVAEPWVWWYEFRYDSTRYNFARIAMAIGLLAFLSAYIQVENASPLVIVLVSAGCWWYDKLLIAMQRDSIAKGPLPNPLRRKSTARIIQLGFILILLMLSLGRPPITLLMMFSKCVLSASAIAAIYILSCNPLPMNYK